ncbi:prolyl oligopeptidase family serine peptidase [Acidicapsa dinghuensis]|uniref:prolyl oligopeptidase n=1 Tax=Acidicapsa dinghuensis TaxID=2218256 RepID=A0ABW1EEX2_9BACT|nr:prolyl oligopeptidase family serine peptidase [Acidicapsa dinghuensis]
MPLSVAMPAFEETLHGVTVRDPYRWLEERGMPETEAWIREQQRRCKAYFDGYPDFECLERRVRDYLDVEVVDQPSRVADRYFYRMRRKYEEQGSIYVREAGTTEERLLVDPSRDGLFTSVGIHRVSEDAKLVAIEVGRGGGDRKEIHIVDVERGSAFPDCIPMGHPRGLAFTRESSGCLYAQDTEDSPNEHFIRLHQLGQGGEDEVLFHAPRTVGSRLVLIANDLLLGAYCLRQQGTERFADFWVASMSEVCNWATVFRNRRLPYGPIFCQDRILVLTAGASRNATIVELSTNGEEIRTVIPETEFPIRQVVITRDRIYVSRQKRDGSAIEVWGTQGQQTASIDLPTHGTVELFPGHTQHAKGLLYSHESYDMAPAIYEYDAETGASTLWHQKYQGYRVRRLQIREECFESKDGVLVPLTLVAQSEEVYLRPSPIIMTSYGGFGVSTKPRFSVLITIMMELGAILAVPHIRGGGEFDRAWHDAGRARNRQVCFDDFLAAAEWLCSQRIASTRQLAIFGGSNAGLLVATAMIQRPDLFGAVLSIAPLLDMVHYESFDHAIQWRHEYGTVEDPEDFRALFAYSPYHHISDSVDYPPILFVAGDKDDRCNPAHVRKMAAALQERDSQRSPVIVDYSEERGHSPLLPLSVRVQALARRIAFLCRELAIPLPKGDLDATSRS